MSSFKMVGNAAKDDDLYRESNLLAESHKNLGTLCLYRKVIMRPTTHLPDAHGNLTHIVCTSQCQVAFRTCVIWEIKKY